MRCPHLEERAIRLSRLPSFVAIPALQAATLQPIAQVAEPVSLISTLEDGYGSNLVIPAAGLNQCGVSPDTLVILRQRGHTTAELPFGPGAVQAILWNQAERILEGGSDRRALDGAAFDG